MPLPASIDAERFLLGTLIRDSIPFPPDLSPADFAEPKHQDIAQAVRDLEVQGTARDENTVTTFLRDVKSNVEPVYVNELTDIVGFSIYNPAWAVEVRRQSALRSLQLAAAKALEHVAKPGVEPDLIADFLTTEAERIRKRTTTESPLQRMDLADLEAFDPENDPDCVIGNRWLCKGGSMLLVSQSGVGKSSFVLQFVISLCVQRPFFGIRAKRPLRVAMIQAENDRGDVSQAFQSIVGGMQLVEPERRMLYENLHLYRDTTSTGDEFIQRLKDLTEMHQPDVVVVDPLLSYCGIEVADQRQVTEFCRHKLAPWLHKSGAILIAVHHTTKPKAAKDKEGMTMADLAYAGAGASELVNFVREVGVIQRMPGDEPVFKFSLTKRRTRARMEDALGTWKGDILIRHSKTPDTIRWEYANTEDAGEPPKASQGQTRPASQTPRQSSGKASPSPW